MLRVVIIGVLAGVVVTACHVRVVEPRDPSLIGIVASREFRSGSIMHVGLTSGQSIDIDPNRVKVLRGGQPNVGDLLFYGDAPDPWFVAIQPDQRGVFAAASRVDGSADGSITLDSGLRLPIAPTYREIHGPIEADAPVFYIVNEKGEVTERL